VSPPVRSTGDPGIYARAQCRPPSELTTAIPGSVVNNGVSVGPLTATQRVADGQTTFVKVVSGRLAACALVQRVPPSSDDAVQPFGPRAMQ
jgi:hypothetical protein